MEQYEFDAAVKSVNSEKPDSAGNVKVDTGVTTINGEAPDENGNVNVGGMPVGFEYFQMNPNIPAGSLPLLGGLYSRSTYADLWEWVQAQHGYLKTEGEWQGLAAENGGSVPFYSSGDGSSNFRVPALSCWVKGAEGIEEVGSYLEAGSLDHYHAFGYNTANNSGTFIATNASDEYTFKEGTRGWNGSSGGGGFTPVENKKGNFNMITSYSAGMEGDMRPPSIVGLWLVKALAKIDTTGTATTDQIAENIEELNRTITNNIPSLATGIAKMQSYFQGTFTKTLLWGNEKVWSNANSTINLSQPWRDFDGLQFCMFFDDSAYRPFQAGGQILWKWEFEEAIRLARLNPTGQGRIIRLGFGDGVYIQWRADGNMPSDMALTVSDENCGIGAVYGISLNAKGITNNSAIDVTEIQEKIGGMFTADNHLRLPSGLEVW